MGSVYVPKSAKKASKSEVPQGPLVTEPRDAAASSRAERESRIPQPGPRPNVNPELDSFEAVMNAMEAELSRLHPKQSNHPPPQAAMEDKVKEKEKVGAPEDEDIEVAMAAELKAALERGDEDESGDENEQIDYNLIKNFLESFKSQAGLSGPVSNLASRLQPGFKFPRDEL